MDEQHTFDEEMNRALEAFVSSSRYGFLKSLQIGKLIGSDAGALGRLADLTFEGLIELGGEQLSALSGVQKRVLISTLYALSEGEANSSADEGLTHSDGIVVNSVQAELDLREKIRALETHPQFEKNKRQKLGAYWDPKWERAPFEEAFTLAQLVAMDLSTLQKKRSVGPSRVLLLTKAVERVIQRLSGFEADEKPAKEEAATRAKAVPPPRTFSLPVEEPHLHPWMSEVGKLSLFEAAFLEYVLQQPARMAHVDTAKGSLIRAIPALFSAHDMVVLAQLAEPPKPLVKKLKTWLASYSEESEVAMLQEALQGPGLHVDRVLSLLNLAEWPPAFGRLVAVMFLRALGAQPIKYNSLECQEVYSLNPGLAQLLVTGLKGSSKSPNALSNLLKVACPAMDPFLHSWLCQAVKSAKRR